MDDFTYDCVKKKKLAKNALYKKNGSKSKKCSLSTDGITQKEWEALNGPVLTYRLGEPMSWKQFKEMPPDLQGKYLQKLVDDYDASTRMMGEMFGVNQTGILQYAKRHSLAVKWSKRKGHMPNETKRRWECFIAGEEYQEPKEAIDISEPIATKVDSTDTKDDSSVGKEETNITTDISITMKGDINVEDVVSIMRSLLGDASRGTLLISFEKEEDI